jgi:sulfotransferase family protein
MRFGEVMRPGKTPKWRALRGWMRATQQARALPSFLLIGAPQSGSTSFFAYLLHVPGVMPALVKEVAFFNQHHARGTGWYRSFFPLRATVALERRRLGFAPAVGEGTPGYLSHAAAPARVRAIDPEMRLIAILRDPVERTFSHYQKVLDRKRETLGFAEALAAEPERVAGELGRMEADGSYYSQTYRRFAYVGRSLYADQLERWLAVFRREQLLVLTTDELADDPAGVVAQAAAFLGLPPPELDEVVFPRKNTRAYDPIEPELREQLARRFAEPNRRLYELVGRDLGWTRPATGAETEAR